MYHIIFTVRRNFNTGNLILDSFISYPDEEVQKVKQIRDLTNNKLWKGISNIQAAEMVNYKDKGFPEEVWAMSLRVRYNTDMKIGHMTSEFEITRKMFEDYVKSSNYDSSAKEKLMSSLRN